MIANHYVFTLPADYDMNIIRKRVADKGAAFDSLDELILKAFLISEKGVNGNGENAYAPFYVWQTEKGLLDFLCSDKFKTVTQAFGWASVKTWMVLDYSFGNRALEPKYATQKIVQISSHTNMQRLLMEEMEFHQKALQLPGVHSRVISLNPTVWEIMRFTLWNAPPEVRESEKMNRYEILHISAPQNH